MRVVAFMTDPPVIKRILDHLARRARATRAPPALAPTAAWRWRQTDAHGGAEGRVRYYLRARVGGAGVG